MNRFDFYPGDYLRDTIDLRPDEEGIYLRLMLWYYWNEKPIPDIRAFLIARVASDVERQKTKWILERFFKLEIIEENGVNIKIWRHKRIDREICNHHQSLLQAR